MAHPDRTPDGIGSWLGALASAAAADRDGSVLADFATSPAMGGLFGIAGALIALTAAGVAATVSRISARRGEWWDRAEWALQLAISRVSREREAGLSALRILAREATKNEGEMIDAVTSVYVADLDGASEQAENDGEGGAVDVEQEELSGPT
ncbi:hypothetical protein [Cnuibacter physcomitrellae]|uniref:hypothetical protein n=1 Tax=Cnuibacter physcomitrellae TaxID=1619308 RepID=UPI0012F49260|nr:hypothetical protein [Cnuibacter physcomitrellae]